MNYILKPSLEHIALIKVVVALWNQDDIRDLMLKFCIPFCGSELKDEWPKIEDKVKEKVVKLPLPVLLIDKITGFIKPIGFKILRWMKHHGDAFGYIDLPGEFHWTPQGTINEKKTAEMLVKDDSIDITTRYKISCVYCLESDILKLWCKVPEISKKSVYTEEDPTDLSQQELLALWTYDINGNLDKMDSRIERRLNRSCSPYVYAFECAAKHGNRAAIEYFLRKLTPNERKESLIKTAGSVAYDTLDPGNHRTKFIYEYYSDILCILLSLMDEEEQLEMFEKYSCQVLLCFLDFPWQVFFEETASIMWKFLDKDNYGVLLGTMVRKVSKGFKDFNYQKLFGENLQQSPKDHKDCVLNGNSIFASGYLLAAMFKIRDENNIKLIFRDPDFTAKKRIFYSHNGQKICEDLIDGEEWDLLAFFIEECMSSRKEMVRFKNDFIRVMIKAAPKSVYNRLKKKWDTFLCMLDDLIGGFNKRKCIEDDSREVKRLCSSEFEE